MNAWLTTASRRLLAAVFLFGSLAGLSAAAAEKAPGFTLKDQTGNDVSLSDFAGKLVVLEWFNDRCPVSSGHHHPNHNTMVDTYNAYKDKDVVFLAINSSHFAGVAYNAKARDRFKIPYPVLDDHDGTVGKAYSAKVTPHMFVIAKDGSIAYNGAIDNQKSGDNLVAQALDALLAGKEVAVPKTRPYGCGVKYAR